MKLTGIFPALLAMAILALVLPAIAQNGTDEMKVTRVSFEVVGRDQPLVYIDTRLNGTIAIEELWNYSITIEGENGTRSDRIGYAPDEIERLKELRFINKTTEDLYTPEMAVEQGLLNACTGQMNGVEPYVEYKPTFTGTYRFQFWLWDDYVGDVGKIQAVALYHNGTMIDRQETPFEYTPIYGEYIIFTPSRKVSYTFS